MFKRLPFRKEKNRMPRRPAYEAIEIENQPGMPPYAGILKDISPTGAHLHVFDAQSLPRTLVLHIPVLDHSRRMRSQMAQGQPDWCGVQHADRSGADAEPAPGRPPRNHRSAVSHQDERLRIVIFAARYEHLMNRYDRIL